MRRAIPLLLLVLPLAGCGSGASYSSGSLGLVAAPSSIGGGGTVQAGSGQVVVRMSEDYFRPNVIVGDPGATVAIRVDNVGKVAHAFDVSGEGQKVDVTVQPGRSATVHVQVPRVGRLLFFCKYHWSRGMAGYLQARR